MYTAIVEESKIMPTRTYSIKGLVNYPLVTHGPYLSALDYVAW